MLHNGAIRCTSRFSQIHFLSVSFVTCTLKTTWRQVPDRQLGAGLFLCLQYSATSRDKTASSWLVRSAKKWRNLLRILPLQCMTILREKILRCRRIILLSQQQIIIYLLWCSNPSRLSDVDFEEPFNLML